MQNKLLKFIREQGLVSPGDRVICAVSGGADSVALLFALYLLKDKINIQLEAAHFNHHLRGEESQRDEAFVRDFCARYDIPLHVGGAQVQPGKKGLEAAARDARYAFLQSLDGKIATIHTPPMKSTSPGTSSVNANFLPSISFSDHGLREDSIGVISAFSKRFFKPCAGVAARCLRCAAFRLHSGYSPHRSRGRNVRAGRAFGQNGA